MSNRPNFSRRAARAPRTPRAGTHVAVVPPSMWVLPLRRRLALITLTAHADAAGRSSKPAHAVLRPFWESGGYGPTWSPAAGPVPIDFGDSLDDCVDALVAAGEVRLLDDGYEIVRLGEWEDVIRQQMGRGGWAELRTGGWGWIREMN